MADGYLLAIDGGGSKTIAVAADSTGTVLGMGRGDCGNHQMVGVRAAVGEVWRAASQALTTAGLDAADVTFTQYALAGADRTSDVACLAPELATLALQPWNLVCDTFAGLRLGSPARTGVALVCGSGTNAVGRDMSGHIVQVGGYGWDFGDAAGGHLLAAFALRAAVRSWEGRDIASFLTEQVPREFGYPDMATLIAELAGRDPWQSAPHTLDSLPRQVHAGAAAGDRLCIGLLTEMGAELGNAGCAVLRQLGAVDSVGEDGEVPVVLIGSVVQHGRSVHLMRALEAQFKQQPRRTRLVIPELEPVFGALMLAMDHAGLPVTPAMLTGFARAAVAVDANWR